MLKKVCLKITRAASTSISFAFYPASTASAAIVPVACLKSTSGMAAQNVTVSVDECTRTCSLLVFLLYILSLQRQTGAATIHQLFKRGEERS